MLFVIALIGCGKDAKSYYPLKESKEWKYNSVVKASGPFGGISISDSIEATLTNMASRELSGKKTVPQNLEIKGRPSTYLFVVEDKNGIYEYASQSSNDVEPTIHKKPAYIIKYPLEQGKEWEEESITSSKIQIKLKASIESTNETVTVPAGNFTGCLKIKKTGTATQTVRSFFGSQTKKINVEEYKWFAPGVGVVKMLQKEDAKGGFNSGSEEASMELTSYK